MSTGSTLAGLIHTGDFWRVRPLGTLALLSLAALAVLLGPMASAAAAEDTAKSVVVNGTLAADGSLRLSQTLEFGGAAPALVSQRIATREVIVGDREYVYTVREIQATAGGADLEPSIDEGSDSITITVNTEGVSAPVVIDYTVVGAAADEADLTVVRWRLVQGLSVGVDTARAVVGVPGLTQDIRCTAGAPDTSQSCAFAAGSTDVSQVPVFENGPLGRGQILGMQLSFDPQTVASNAEINRRWTLGGAFSVGPVPLITALVVLLGGAVGLYLLHRRIGRHTSSDGDAEAIASFYPVGDGVSEFRASGTIRPGHVGTIADERVDPIDVTASLLDLAVRGHVLIVELPRASEHAPVDWTLTRLPSEDPLADFEVLLLDAVAPEGAEAARVSQIGSRVGAHIEEIQSALYDEMVERGWYERRPDATRSSWSLIASGALIGAIVFAGLLVAFSEFGLLGMAFIALALGLAFIAQEMPSRTAKGTAVLAGMHALSAQLHTHPTDQPPPGHALGELSKVLPYAIVLGGRERWLDAIVAADRDDVADPTDLAWYHGPDTWHLADLPHSLRNFVNTVSGNLFSR